MNMKSRVKQKLSGLGYFEASLLVIMGTFIIWPLATVFGESFTSPQGLTLSHYLEFFTSSEQYILIIHSFSVAIPVTIISTILGFIFAYTAARYDLFGERVFRAAAILPLIIPPFLIAFSITLLIGRNGILTNLIGWWGGEIYGWPGLVISQSICFIPYVYLTLLAPIQSLNPALEKCARDLGASEFESFKDISLSLLTPSILNTSFLVFILSMADFGTPMLIGGRFDVLSVSIYHDMIGKSNPHMAAVTGVVLITPLLLFFLARRRLLAKKSYVTVTGGREGVTGEGKGGGWIRRVMSATLISVSLFIFFITGLVVFMSFTEIPLLDYSLSLTHYIGAITQGYLPVFSLFRNTLYVAIGAPIIVVIIGFCVAYLSVRKDKTPDRVLDFVGMLPFAIPGTVFGIGYLFLFNTGLFNTGFLAMTGTLYILIVNVAFHNLPVSLTAAKNNLVQIDETLEKASQDLGASKTRSFKDVLIPIWKPAILGVVLYTFITGLKTISAVIFLISPEWNLVVTEILNLLSDLSLGLGTVLSTFLILMAILAQYALQKVEGDVSGLF